MKLLSTIILITFFVGGCGLMNDVRPLSEFKGGIVVQKERVRRMNDGDVSGWWVYVESDRRITAVKTVEFYYNKYSIGDTIK